MKNKGLGIIVVLAFCLGVNLLHFGYPKTFFCLSGVSSLLGVFYLFRGGKDLINILVAKVCGMILMGLSLSWVLAAFVNPVKTPTAWPARTEAQYRQEHKMEKERLEKLSLLVPDLDKDLNQMGITVTILSDLELVMGRLYVFRGQRSDDKTERLIFYEMPDSRCIMETSRVPKKGDKLVLMVRTFRATDGWYAPLGQNPLATIYFVKNKCI